MPEDIGAEWLVTQIRKGNALLLKKNLTVPARALQVDTLKQLHAELRAHRTREAKACACGKDDCAE